MPEQQSSTRRFWLGGKRAAEQDRFFREALESQGWEQGDETHWDAAWITGMPDPAQFHKVSAQRKLNHFPGNAVLTVKSRLHDCLSRLRDRVEDTWGPDSEEARRLAFFPRSYVMPRDYRALQAAAADDPDRRWILKPTNASKGKGVRVLQDVAEAPLAPNWMVQEYLANPHTIRGHKYVLRLYVLISSLAPLRVYLYRQGFAKLASEPWDPDDADNPYSQLTNPDINALNEQAEVPVEFIDLDRYRAWLRDQGHDDAALFARIEDLISLTAIAGVDAMRWRTAEAGADPRGGYELLGLDCLVDDTLTPWILECNLSPSLGTCAAPEHGGSIEEAVKGGLVRDLIRLVDIPAEGGHGSSPALSLLTEAEAELARAGGFQRLLPSPTPERYLPFFSLPSPEDVVLAAGVADRPLTGPVLVPRRVLELFHGEAMALYDPGAGRLYRPNDSATLIWLLATEGLTPDAIATRLDEALNTADQHATDQHATDKDALAPNRPEASASGLPVVDEQATGAMTVDQRRALVWHTLWQWCRDGLLRQRGEESDGARPARAQTTAVQDPVWCRLELDGRQWALTVADAAALARLECTFGGCLVTLDEAPIGLPRLSILHQAGHGYALANDKELLASGLPLAQLVARLGSELLRRSARPGCPVIDLPLVITAEGRAELWLAPLPPAGLPETLAERLASAPGSRAYRGVRLHLADPSRLDCPGVPVTELPTRGTGSLSHAERGRSSLSVVMSDGMSFMEAMGLLVRHVVTAGGLPLAIEEVQAVADWLASCWAESETHHATNPMSGDP